MSNSNTTYNHRIRFLIDIDNQIKQYAGSDLYYDTYVQHDLQNKRKKWKKPIYDQLKGTTL